MDLDDVVEKLEAFGYTVTDSDETLLELLIAKVTSTIKNEVNVADIPEGLSAIAVDMVIGEFLQLKKVMAPDDLSMLDLGAAVASIQAGDTNVSFATGDSSSTDEERLDALISYLLSYGKSEFSSFRRIRW